MAKRWEEIDEEITDQVRKEIPGDFEDVWVAQDMHYMELACKRIAELEAERDSHRADAQDKSLAWGEERVRAERAERLATEIPSTVLIAAAQKVSEFLHTDPSGNGCRYLCHSCDLVRSIRRRILDMAEDARADG